MAKPGPSTRKLAQDKLRSLGRPVRRFDESGYILFFFSISSAHR